MYGAWFSGSGSGSSQGGFLTEMKLKKMRFIKIENLLKGECSRRNFRGDD
jgi:hypothetical protein